MALISHADWLDRFGDDADDDLDVVDAPLRFELRPAAPPFAFGAIPWPGLRGLDRPLLGYRAGAVERRAAPRPAR